MILYHNCNIIPKIETKAAFYIIESLFLNIRIPQQKTPITQTIRTPAKYNYSHNKISIIRKPTLSCVGFCFLTFRFVFDYISFVLA
jgi:hypothetical protein